MSACSNCTTVARAIAFSVSPVASETRCRLSRTSVILSHSPLSRSKKIWEFFQKLHRELHHEDPSPQEWFRAPIDPGRRYQPSTKPHAINKYRKQKEKSSFLERK